MRPLQQKRIATTAEPAGDAGTRKSGVVEIPQASVSINGRLHEIVSRELVETVNQKTGKVFSYMMTKVKPMGGGDDGQAGAKKAVSQHGPRQGR